MVVEAKVTSDDARRSSQQPLSETERKKKENINLIST